MNSMMAGSRSPERVPMISPSSGVNPIDVSTDSPPLTAVTLAPFPKWHTMIFKSLISFPKTFAVSKDTN